MSDPSDETLLEELLTGARPTDDPEAARRLAGDPALAERYANLRRLAAQLDEVGAADRAQRRQDLSTASPLEPDVVRTVRSHWQQVPRRRQRSRWLAAGVAALAVAGALLLWWVAGRGTPADENVYLGPAAPTAMRVTPQPDGSAVFAWDLGRGEAQYAELRFYTPDGRTEVGAMLMVEDTQQWTANTAQRAALPVEFLWEVRAFDLSGRRLGTQRLLVHLPH